MSWRRDQEAMLNRQYIEPHDLDPERIHALRRLLESHHDATGSESAREFIANSDAEIRAAFCVCTPVTETTAQDQADALEDPTRRDPAKTTG